MVSATRNKRNATRGTRGGARGGVRRGSARDEVLGRAPASPTTRARAAAASGSPSPALNPAAHAATKIIVSNLPIDVNEVQVKVRATSKYPFLSFSDPFLSPLGTILHHRRTHSWRQPQLRPQRQVQGRRRGYLPEARRRKQGVHPVQQAAYRRELVSTTLPFTPIP